MMPLFLTRRWHDIDIAIWQRQSVMILAGESRQEMLVAWPRGSCMADGVSNGRMAVTLMALSSLACCYGIIILCIGGKPHANGRK